MASRARLVRASNRRTPVSYRETTLWATPSMPPSSLCEIPSFFLTVRISIMVTTYAYTDIRVNRVIHQRIGESHMRDLSAAMNEIIAANVKLLRQRHAPNQTVFGEQIGVSQATVARWERGGDMKPESLARLAELAGCSASEFITQLLPEQASRVGRAPFRSEETTELQSLMRISYAVFCLKK